ncbi:MAG: hypothetical protein QNI87_06790 [Erythrobacter sp.]|uniref:hypothetical protein n=1 Tax=Erythrobacter sp. TaxID=1042 RepID=UPI0026049468|nr:hypothetical protein [Erythrobacter sp.]MDJ0978224.1 hypothetical protein [Erythrobacter sp.]
MATNTISQRRGTSLTLSALAGISLLLSPALAQDEEPDPPEKTEEKKSKAQIKGEKRLAKMLEGRVAGEPQDCIRMLPTNQMTTIDRTAYVFGRGNTIYVQRTTRPDQIRDRDTLITRRFGGGAQLCRQDIATTVDPLTQIFTGAVMFEDFVPYTRVDKDENEGNG